MKVTNMYKGVPVRRDRFRFLASCSSLIFSNPNLYWSQSHFYILIRQIKYMSTKNFWDMLLLQIIINLFEDPGNMFVFLRFCVSERIFVFIPLLAYQRIPSEQTGNWEAKTMPRALLYWEYLILFFTDFYNRETSISTLASVL